MHLDLHPLNVILEPERGPIVIDWANASRGEALSDIAITYVLLTCPRMPGPLPLARGGNTDPSRASRGCSSGRIAVSALDERIALAADAKAEDSNMDAHEIATMHRLAARMRRKTAG